MIAPMHAHPLSVLENVVVASLASVAIVLVLQDAFEVMLLPRRAQRRVRFAVAYFRTAWRACSRLAAVSALRGRREGLLSHFGALSMLGLFTAWAASLIVGFGVLEWAFSGTGRPGGAHSPLSEQIYMSGVTFFTLGFGDVVPHDRLARIGSVVEAGVGLGFIACVIGYLPLIHQLFSRREALVIQLDVRAGSPPTAGGLLRLHAGAPVELDRFLSLWETWGAELLEGHLSYPMLAFYRSQHDNQSWLAALTAVTDACALLLVGAEDRPTFQARMTFGVLRQVVVEMAGTFRIDPAAPGGGGRRLSDEVLESLRADLREAGVALGPETGGMDAAAVAALRALEATYEPLLAGLARYLLTPLPPLAGGDATEPHWARGYRGRAAARLVDRLSA